MKAKWIAFVALIAMMATAPLSAQTESSVDQNESSITCPPCPGASDEEAVFTHVERRDSMPIQVQLVHTFGPATPNSFAPGGGLHLGFQVSKALYLGWTSSAFVDGRNVQDDFHEHRYDDDDDEDYRYDSDEVYGQEGAASTESELDPIHLLELRITPWDFGLYFSLGAMYRGEQTSTTTFKEQERTIGENEYTTGLEATLDYKEWYGLSTGIGFNYIFQCGLTLGTAFNMGLNAQTPDVTVSSTSTVNAEDLAYWKKQIQSNEQQLPYLYTLSIGYAF